MDLEKVQGGTMAKEDDSNPRRGTVSGRMSCSKPNVTYGVPWQDRIASGDRALVGGDIAQPPFGDFDYRELELRTLARMLEGEEE